MKELLFKTKYAAAIAVVVAWLTYCLLLPGFGIGRGSSARVYGLLGSVSIMQKRDQTAIEIDPTRLGLELAIVAVIASIAEWINRRLSPPTSKPGVCPTCGYDLRGTPSAPGSAGVSGDSGGSGGTCPECGAATPARDPASPRA